MQVMEGNWQRFEEWLSELRKLVGQNTGAKLLFRGQGDSRFKLETTLERSGRPTMAVAEY